MTDDRVIVLLGFILLFEFLTWARGSRVLLELRAKGRKLLWRIQAGLK